MFQKRIVSVSLPVPHGTQPFFFSFRPQLSYLPSSTCVSPQGFLSYSAVSSRKASVDAVYPLSPTVVVFCFFLSNSPFLYRVFRVYDACLRSASRILCSFVSLSPYTFFLQPPAHVDCLESMAKEAKIDCSTTKGTKRKYAWEEKRVEVVILDKEFKYGSTAACRAAVYRGCVLRLESTLSAWVRRVCVWLDCFSSLFFLYH